MAADGREVRRESSASIFDFEGDRVIGSLGFLGELATFTEANAPRAELPRRPRSSPGPAHSTLTTDYGASPKVVGARRTSDLIVLGQIL